MNSLSERGLFESAEFFYETESNKHDLTRNHKLLLTAAIVHSRSLQILSSTPFLRRNLLEQLTKFETKFPDSSKNVQTDPDSILATEQLQLQFAIAAYHYGNLLQLESATAQDNDQNKLESEAKQILQNTITLLKKIDTNIVAQKNITHTEQFNLLKNRVNLYRHLAERAAALMLPQDEKRYDKLNEITKTLDGWIKNSESKNAKKTGQNYFVLFHLKLELAACYRLLNEFDKAHGVLSSTDFDLTNVDLPEDVRLHVAAERIRYSIATAIVNANKIPNADNADADKNTTTQATKKFNIDELLNCKTTIPAVFPDYFLAKLEWGVFLTERIKINDSTTELMCINDLLKLVRQIDLYTPCRNNHALTILASNNTAKNNSHNKTNNNRIAKIKETILSELAHDKYERKQFEYAIYLYELAGRIGYLSGELDSAVKNSQYSASILYEQMEQLEKLGADTQEITQYRIRLVVSLQNTARRFRKNPSAVDFYRRSIDEATILFRAKHLGFEAYIEMLGEYVSLWSDESDCAAIRLRGANLLALESQFEEALDWIDKIPNKSNVAVDAIKLADSCLKKIRFKKINDAKNNADINVDVINESSIAREIDWFRKRLNENESDWTDADAAVAIMIAERLLYKNNTPITCYSTDKKIDALKNAEIILNNTIKKCKTITPIAKTQLNMMLIAAYNSQNEHQKSTEIFRQITKDQKAKLTIDEIATLQRMEIEILAETGKSEDAMRLLENLLKQDQRNLLLQKLKAEILSRRNDTESLTESVRTWGLIATMTKEQSEIWWHAREQIITILIKQKNNNEAKKSYNRLKILYPDLGNEQRKNRLEKAMTNIQ
ncbi:MAG: hypothetical protein LBQ66_14920 [Planctomycetaceae bacterium]|nr:hypothetical protein [Planctomycetaceae bacterium]